jgi:hypothetical protein
VNQYAADTKVSPSRSREEIERTLSRYGCEHFAYHSGPRLVQIAFEMHDRTIRFDLPMPSRHDDAYTKTPTGKKRSPKQSHAAWEKDCRQKWRALALVIKAKLEAVESGITTFEVEFMGHIVMPGGKLFKDVALPAIAESYETQKPPVLMLGSGD